MTTNATFKLFADKLGGTRANTYIGTTGDLFYDPEIGSIKLSNGTTSGGISITQPTVVSIADNRWYVDPSRTDIIDGASTGSLNNPFLSITSALAYIEAKIADGSLTISISGTVVDNPQFIILTSSTTENVTLTRGHIFIIGDTPDAGHVPIWIHGHVTITPSAAGANALNINKFGLFHVAVIPSGANHGIEFNGTNPGKVYLEDTYVWQGNDTKACVYANNTGTGSRLELLNCSMSKDVGSGYLVNIQRGYAKIENLETNGNGQVLNFANDSTGTMLNSAIDASTGSVITLSGSVAFGMGTCILNNTGAAANTYGVTMSGTSTMQFGVCTFNIPSAQATNRAINGTATNTVLYTGPVFQYGTSDKISTAITLIPLDTIFTPA
jgi:hypothetical protein